MSAAKEIVIVEHSQEHSPKASTVAGSNGSGMQMLRVPRTRTALQQ